MARPEKLESEISSLHRQKVRLSNWQRTLKEIFDRREVLFVGVGNRFRGDDGVGVFLGELLLPFANVLLAGERPENLLGLDLSEIECLIFLDACKFGGKPGEIGLFSIRDVKDNFIFTHRVPLGLISSLSKIPEVKILCIEPARLGYRSDMSAEVKESAYRVKDFIASFKERRYRGDNKKT